MPCPPDECFEQSRTADVCKAGVLYRQYQIRGGLREIDAGYADPITHIRAWARHWTALADFRGASGGVAEVVIGGNRQDHQAGRNGTIAQRLQSHRASFRVSVKPGTAILGWGERQSA